MDKVTKWLNEQCQKCYSDTSHEMKYEEYRKVRGIVRAPVYRDWGHQDKVSKQNKE